MPNIQHGMMPNKQKPVPATKPPQMKVATVMPPEDEEAVFNKDMAELENVAVEQVEIAESPSVKHQLDKKRSFDKLMLFKQPKIKEVIIGGVKFRIKRLSSDESCEVFKELAKLPTQEQMLRIDAMTLAVALIDMDGVQIEDFYSGPSEIESLMIKKYLELCTWDTMLLSVLSKAYSDFSKEAEAEYNTSFLDKK